MLINLISIYIFDKKINMKNEKKKIPNKKKTELKIFGAISILSSLLDLFM